MMDFARTAVPNLKAILRAQDRARFTDKNYDASLPSMNGTLAKSVMV